MKHILYATTGIALALAVAGTPKPVMADVDVFASISKDKDITITENITIRKTVVIVVAATFDELEGGAEAQALLNVVNGGEEVGNEVNGTDPSDPIDQNPEIGDEYGIHLSAVMDGSMNDNVGVWGFNQDVGNMTNQANVVSVAGIADTVDAFAQSQAHVDQLNENNTSTEFEELRDAETGELITDPETDPDNFAVNKLASITDSINGNTGVINVNQNSGNMNNQSNAVAAAVGLGAVFALSEADLGQETSHNHVDELSTVKHATITGSINGNSGIVNVNQSAGNMNNQGNVVSVSAITSGAILTTP